MGMYNMENVDLLAIEIAKKISEMKESQEQKINLENELKTLKIQMSEVEDKIEVIVNRQKCIKYEVSEYLNVDTKISLLKIK